MLNHGFLIDSPHQTAPPARLHPKVQTLRERLGRPPERGQLGHVLHAAQETLEPVTPAVLGAAVDAVDVDFALDGVLVLHAQAVRVDEELVDVLFRPVVEPGFAVEFVEWLLHGDLEGFAVVGRRTPRGHAAGFLVGFPVRLLAVTRAVVRVFAFGTALQVHAVFGFRFRAFVAARLACCVGHGQCSLGRYRLRSRGVLDLSRR